MFNLSEVLALGCLICCAFDQNMDSKICLALIFALYLRDQWNKIMQDALAYNFIQQELDEERFEVYHEVLENLVNSGQLQADTSNLVRQFLFTQEDPVSPAFRPSR